MHLTKIHQIVSKKESLDGLGSALIYGLATFLLSLLFLYINLTLGTEHRQVGILLIILLSCFYVFQIYHQIALKTVIKIAAGYAFISFWLDIINKTLNLNNPDFTPSFLSDLGIRESLLVMLPVVVLAWTFSALKQWRGSLETDSSLGRLQLREKWQENVVISQLWTCFILTSTQFTDRFLTNRYFPLSAAEGIQVGEEKYLLLYCFTFYIIFSVVSYAFIVAFDKILKNELSPSLPFVVSVFLAIIFNYTIQAGITVQGGYYDSFVISGATIFQIIILTCLFLLVYSLVNRFLLATILNVIFGLLFSLTNEVKFKLRDEPIMISDLSWLSNIGFFKEYISDTIIKYSIGGVIVLIILLFLLWERWLPGPIFKTWKGRAFHISAVLSVLMGIFGIFKSAEHNRIAEGIPVLSNVYNVSDVDWLGITANARFQSLSYVWLKELSSEQIDKPDEYGKEQIGKLYEKYKALANDINATRQNNPADQTVIFVLSESFSDPSRVPGIEVSNDPIPNIRNIMAETTSGLMKSDGYGGGTANMEFQALSGLPKHIMNNTAHILHTQVVPKMSKLPSISDLFEPKSRIAYDLIEGKGYIEDYSDFFTLKGQ